MDDLLRLAGWLAVGVYVLAIAYAALSDLKSYEIPNWVSPIVLACFFPIAWAAGWDLAAVGWHLGTGGAVLVVGFLLYLAGITGAGDVKLMAAASVLVGWAALVEFIVLITLAGGALALIVLALRRVPLGPRLGRVSWLARLHEPGRGLPYGVAISAGALYVLPFLPLIAALRAP